MIYIYRDVLVTFDSIDKMGGFIGSIQLVDGHANPAFLLLEKGYASIHSYSLNSVANSNEYKRAQDDAESKKLGIWSIERVQKEEPIIQDTTKQVFISEIVDGQIFVQVVSEQLSKLESLMVTWYFII